MKDEYVHCAVSENTATLLDEPLVLVPFILKLCNVWQKIFSTAVDQNYLRWGDTQQA